MMIKLENIVLTPDQSERLLEKKAAKMLGVSESEIKEIKILRKSVDARKKRDVKLIYSLGVVLNGESGDEACEEYSIDKAGPHLGTVVVAGAGPAGLFSALTLARAGARVVLLERGSDVLRRKKDIESFLAGGSLDTESNVQFGLGGAGTFSDGKLTTGKNDPRLNMITEAFIKFGATEDIAYLSKPHIGTDRLVAVVGNLRDELIRLGVDVRFGAKFDMVNIKNSALSSVVIREQGSTYEIPTRHLIIATGHSARDTYQMLYDAGIEMRAKSFSVGVRIEHLQADITRSQYGDFANYDSLPVPDYKLSCHLDSGRSAYSFCVCPGGSVIAAASEEGKVVTNGMSVYARDGMNINGGLLVGVNNSDYSTDHPLGGMYFQRRLETEAFKLGGGNYFAPCQTVGDFLHGKASKEVNKVQPTYKPGVKMCDISLCLPQFVTETLREAITVLGRRLKGFDDPEALLTAVETRSSAPVNIPRDDRFFSNVTGIYPCGEGAGYAGGIMSAAADGIKIAEAVLSA